MWEEEKTLLNLSALCLIREVWINTGTFDPHGHSCRGTCQWFLWLALRSPLVSPYGFQLLNSPISQCFLTHLLFVVFSTLITATLAHLCSNSHVRIIPPSPNQDLGPFHWICQLKKNVSVKSADHRLINLGVLEVASGLPWHFAKITEFLNA